MTNPTVTTAAGTRQVPLLDLTRQFASIREEALAAVTRVLEGGRYILGPDVAALEEEVAAYCGTAHAVGCASGTDALLLSLRALDVGPGDEVVTPAYSFFASASTISLAGARPVFCDIEPDTYNLDPERLAAALTPRTRAVIAVHLFGQCADMEAIRAVADRRSLPVIEDAAQSIGAAWKGRRAGQWGTLACFSFFPTKNLGSAGDGGMVVTDREDLARRLKRLRGHGAEPKYHHHELGLNSRLDSVQAAILRVKLPRLEGWTEARRRNADTYRDRLSGAGVGLPIARPESFHVYNQFTIRSDRRDALRAHLTQAGVGTEIYYPGTLPSQPCFADVAGPPGSYPVAERAARETLALPIFPELTADDLTYVADRVREFSTR
jgi:dTDP-4-amino-4,6-dideoxygalactose transaminase